MRIGTRCLINALLIPVAVIALFGTGCKKENGIVNNNVIRTPYGLLIGQVNGKVENTNDGASYQVVFSIDNSLPRTIMTTGLNVLMVKYNPQLGHGGQDLFLLQSDNPKPNFNYVSSVHLNPAANWASMLLDVTSHDAVYASTITSTGTPSASVSYDHGISWTDASDGTQGADISKSTSFTQTRDGNLYSLDPSPTIYQRTGKKLAWSQTGTTGLPAGNFYLSHINNTLLAADHSGPGGVYYSTDKGANWTQYPGLNDGEQVLSLYAPFDQVVLAGMDSVGVFRLVNGTFVPSNNGLEPFTSVYGIVGKENIFKNDVIKQYVYIATNKGLFRSEDLGQNWTKLRSDDFRVIY